MEQSSQRVDIAVRFERAVLIFYRAIVRRIGHLSRAISKTLDA
jgi:hypothetical protein